MFIQWFSITTIVTFHTSTTTFLIELQQFFFYQKGNYITIGSERRLHSYLRDSFLAQSMTSSVSLITKHHPAKIASQHMGLPRSPSRPSLKPPIHHCSFKPDLWVSWSLSSLSSNLSCNSLLLCCVISVLSCYFSWSWTYCTLFGVAPTRAAQEFSSSFHVLKNQYYLQSLNMQKK